MKNNRQVTVFIALWLVLTLVVGAAVFFVLLWATAPAPAVAQATPTMPQVSIPTVTAVAQAPTAPPSGDQPAPACLYPDLPTSGFGYGIQAHSLVPGVDPGYGLGVTRDKLGLYWAKLQVRWYVIEPAPGQYDWTVLDNAINAACERGVRALLSVVAAPTWTQANPLPAPEGQEAPPDDFNLYANFVAMMVDRYAGKFQAIEIWNEPNLEREWNTAAGVNADQFAQMVNATAAVIRARNPNIIIVSGAPAPTGINCRGSFPNCTPEGRVIVVDDVSFMQQFIAAGGLNNVDCVGIHSNGSNLPPITDAYALGSDANYKFKGPWANPHYSWTLRSQIEAYLKILPADKPLCMTEFGYASPLDGVYPPGYDFAQDVTEEQQGAYIAQAFDYMRGTGRVKLAFLFNLDYAQLGGDPSVDDNAIFSIINRQGIPRPAFDVIGRMPKP